MPRHVIDHGVPDRFVAGTIGMPGDRTFYLQSRQGQHTYSVVLEKQQVSLLSEKLVELLDEVGRQNPDIAAGQPGPEDVEPLETPVTEEFRVGAFGIGWDTGQQQIVLEIHATTDDEDVEIPDIGDDEAHRGPRLPACLV